MNREQLTRDVANEIQRLHDAATNEACITRESAERAVLYAVQCGGYLAEVKLMTKGRLMRWLMDNVPTMTPERAQAYMSIYHTQEQRQCHAIDKHQLQLIGILEKGIAKKQNNHITKPCDRWFVHCNKIRAWWGKTTQSRPISEWTQNEAMIAANQLRPVVDIYNQMLRAAGKEE